MPIFHPTEAPTHTLPGTTFTSLATPSRGSQDTSVWLVEIAPGTAPTPHQLTRQEVFVVLSGQARVRIGDDHREVDEGGVIVVPVDTPFELANAGDTPLKALCCLPVGGQAYLEGQEPFTPPWAR